ncbi:pentatricopeptide repeat (PPR) superfamily protein [Wolffia australiana]
MVSEGFILGSVSSLRALLRSCGRSSSERGRRLHAALLRNGLLPPSPGPLQPSSSASPSSLSLCSALFHMYAACGPPSTALRAFHCIPLTLRSIADWTALLSCYNRHGLHAETLRLFLAMEEDHVRGDEVTMICVLGACARSGDAAAGAAVHQRVIKRGLSADSAVCNAVMDTYGKCGRMAEARRVFDEMRNPTVVSWTVILSGALRWEGLDSARRVFDLMPEKNDVSFTVMAAGYVEAGLRREALAAVAEMVFSPGGGPRGLSHVSLCALLSACSQAGDLAVGRWAHAFSAKAGAAREPGAVMVSTALVDMYAKCGRIQCARRVFDGMPDRNVVTWNVILGGLAMHGLAEEALRLYSGMTESGVRPDEITLVAVLAACSRAGLVDQGRRFFLAAPPAARKVEHYACMVDLLGRAGLVEEAVGVVSSMPLAPNEVVLGSLLAACALHGWAELGGRVTARLAEMGAPETDHLVILSNIYAGGGRRTAAEALRDELRRRGSKKSPGASFIAVDGQFHRFCAGVQSRK